MLTLLPNPNVFDENFLLNSSRDKNGGNSDFAGAGDLSHARQVSEPLHYRGGLANPKNFLTIYVRASGESRLIRTPCSTRADLISEI